MKFNHLIRINDPLDPPVVDLTREQLWRGLVMRAEAPQLFMPHLDECRLSGRTAVSVERMLRYGELLIHDIVTYTPQRHVHYQVPAQGDIPLSSMCMRIEEPEQNMLFVRFEYDDGASDDTDGGQACYDRLRRAAYEKADADTIRIIRELSARGALENTGNSEKARL